MTVTWNLVVSTILYCVSFSMVTGAEPGKVANANYKLNSDRSMIYAMPIKKVPPPHSFEVAGIELDRSTIADVKRLLGPGNIVHYGDASESFTFICYEGIDGTGLIFYHGESDVVEGATLYRSIIGFSRYLGCTPSKLVTRTMLIGKIGLFFGRKQIESIETKPSWKNKNTVVYLYEEQVRNKTNEIGETDASIEVNFSAGQIQSIDLLKYTQF